MQKVKETYRRKPNVACMICEKQIYRRPGELKRNKGNAFCNLKCYGLSQRVEKPCIICGSPILSGKNKKTCSRACANKGRQGIKYLGTRTKDKVKSQQALKNLLFRVRGKKCERCEYDTFQILQVHHIDRNRQNNIIENLELLCPNCHCREHYMTR